MKRETQLLTINQKLIVNHQDLVVNHQDLVKTCKEIQKNFEKLRSLINKNALKFYESGGYWHDEAKQLDLSYHFQLQDDRTPEILIGLKDWDIDECYEKGNFMCTGSTNPRESMERFSEMFIHEAMKKFKIEMELHESNNELKERGIKVIVKKVK